MHQQNQIYDCLSVNIQHSFQGLTWWETTEF